MVSLHRIRQLYSTPGPLHGSKYLASSFRWVDQPRPGLRVAAFVGQVSKAATRTRSKDSGKHKGHFMSGFVSDEVHESTCYQMWLKRANRFTDHSCKLRLTAPTMDLSKVSAILGEYMLKGWVRAFLSRPSYI